MPIPPALYMALTILVILSGCATNTNKNGYSLAATKSTEITELLNNVSFARDKYILLLGKDSNVEGKRLINEVGELIKLHGFTPIILRDQKDIPGMSLHDKLVLNASISRCTFVLDYEISGHVYELAILDFLRTPTVILRRPNMGSTYMVEDIAFERRSAKVQLLDTNKIEQSINNGIEWCNDYNLGKINYLNQTYPWLKNN